MAFLDFLGVGKSIKDAQDASSQVVQQIAPILRDVENRAFGIADTLLDRVDGAEIVIPEIRITLKLKPIPKAQPVT